jgi:hypothetical protein
MATEYRPGQTVPESGIYDVVHHDACRHRPHQITAVRGNEFPPCHDCISNPRFRLAQAALHLDDHPAFAT